MKITAKKLKKLGACAKGIANFNKVFPRGAELTVDNVLLAESYGLDIDFVADRLLGFGHYDWSRDLVCSGALDNDDRSRWDAHAAMLAAELADLP